MSGVNVSKAVDAPFQGEKPVAARDDRPARLCPAKIKSTFEMNDIRGCRVTCYMEDIRLLRSFGE
jgi:hypothetical protein